VSKQSSSHIISERTRIEHAYAKRKEISPESFFNIPYLFIIQERERQTLKILKRHNVMPLNESIILEIGCGKGYWINDFIKWGGQPQNIVGVDLLFDRVREAKRLTPQDVHISLGDATNLPFRNSSFDVILQSTVFTSVLDFTIKQKIANEMIRLVKPNGLILWYDFHINNPSNSDVRGVSKKEIQKLFPSCRINLSRITLAPPIVRRLAPYSWLACSILERFKILNTHYLGVIRKF